MALQAWRCDAGTQRRLPAWLGDVGWPLLPRGHLSGCPSPCRHRDAMAQVEAMVGRALNVSKASHELLQGLLEGRAAWEAQRELEAG